MAESSNMIQVTVKTLDSRSRTYTVRGELTVRQFKEHITSSVEIPVNKQRLIYQGRVLQDDRTLTEYNVDDKVIHLVERAPPQTSSVSGSGGPGVSTDGTEAGGSSSHTSTLSQGTSHERNGNSYVMLGTFNLPVNIMDPQQIQMSVQQMMTGVGEAGRNTRVSTSTASNGSVDVQMGLDQTLQSEPRMRLHLAENLLRDTRSLLHRLEGVSGDSGSHSELEVSQSSPLPSTSSESGATASMDPTPAPSISTSAQTEGATSSGPNHPSPAEFMEVLSQVRSVEERLRPFIERAHLILGAATSADYNNNIEGREEDQCVLNLVGDALRLLGNTLVVLGDLRCNLSSSPPRHLHAVRPMAQHSHPVLLQAGLPHMPIPINLGTTVTMTSNGRSTADGHQASQSAGQSEQQTSGQAMPSTSNPQQGQGGPRVIRITHQTMEPVVMMQMNIDGDSAGQGPGQSAADPGQPGVPAAQFPGLPPEFMQAIVHQISHQTSAMATASSDGTFPSPVLAPAQARVVISRPAISPRGPQPTGARGTTINLRAMVPTAAQQAGQGPPMAPSPLTQIISGLVGQLLLPGHTGDSMSVFPHSPPPSSGQNPTPSAASVGQPTEGSLERSLAHLLFPPLSGTAAPPPSADPPERDTGGADDSLSPELFTGIVQGVLSTMMSSLGPQQGTGESIAQFIQRLSRTSNLFTPGSGDAMGFFGDLLSLLCQSFSMVDMVLLLHGNAQPLSRVQPQLRDFFTEHYLHGQDPTDQNIQTAAADLINSLEEYIAESFATVTVRDRVDIVQTNLSFLRQQVTQMASHILRSNDETFGPYLLLLSTQALFECLALNLFCLRGEHSTLSNVINHRIRRMSAEVNTGLVNWLTGMMSARLPLILEHNPVSEQHIQHYVIYTQSQDELNQRTEQEEHVEKRYDEMEERLSPDTAITAEEATACSGDRGHSGEVPTPCSTPALSLAPTGQEEGPPETAPWASAVPPEWVPIIRHDMLSQRKIKAQPPLSDAYLHGMPAKRRKTQCEGPSLSLSDAVTRAARTAGVLPVTGASSLQWEVERAELQDSYTRQVKHDIKERVRDDPDYSAQRFPKTHKAFSSE